MRLDYFACDCGDHQHGLIFDVDRNSFTAGDLDVWYLSVYLTDEALSFWERVRGAINVLRGSWHHEHEVIYNKDGVKSIISHLQKLVKEEE